MVVDYFCIFGAIAPPLETNPPLPIDGNTVLALSVTAKSLQPVTGKSSKVAQGFRGIKYFQPFFTLASKTLKSLYVVAIGKTICLFIPIAPDHNLIY